MRNTVRTVLMSGLMPCLILGLLLAVVYYFASPGVDGEGSGLIALALLVGQVYLLVRWVLRISLLGAESLLYRSAQGTLRRSSRI